jgi:hypothetical protein
MDYKILENGNLELTLLESEVEDVTELLEKATNTDHGFLCDLMEYARWPGNGHLYPVQPEWVAALTEAPIISDEVVYEDDDSVRVPGRVWWYPGYELSSFAEVLIRERRVVFEAAPENVQRA